MNSLLALRFSGDLRRDCFLEMLQKKIERHRKEKNDLSRSNEYINSRLDEVRNSIKIAQDKEAKRRFTQAKNDFNTQKSKNKASIEKLEKMLKCLRSNESRVKKSITIMQQGRIGKKAELVTMIERMLDDVAKIKKQSYHGGDFHGVDCIRFLNNSETIMGEVEKMALERLGERREMKRAFVKDDELVLTIRQHADFFEVLDVVISLLRQPAPTKKEKDHLRKGVEVLKRIWVEELEMRITPKAHIIFDHAADQYEEFDGIADKVEDFVEKFHQKGIRLDNLTKRMAKSFDIKQRVQLKRLWLTDHPKVKKRISDVREASTRNLKRLRTNVNEIKKQVRVERRMKTELELIDDLLNDDEE